jgi:ATP-dependent protease HslVU (ClpYQ) peptidase subunit
VAAVALALGWPVTAILGVGDGTTAWLATDGRNSYGHTAVPDRNKRPIHKLLSTGDEFGAVVAGYGVTARMLRQWVPLDDLDPSVSADDLLNELAEDFGQYVMAEETSWRRVVQQEDPGAHGSALIFALRGTVALVDARFNAILTDSNCVTEGCGGDYALGAALALHDTGHPWDYALLAGLRYAATLDVHVGPPYSVLTLTASGTGSGKRSG